MYIVLVHFFGICVGLVWFTERQYKIFITNSITLVLKLNYLIKYNKIKISLQFIGFCVWIPNIKSAKRSRASLMSKILLDTKRVLLAQSLLPLVETISVERKLLW